MLGCLLFRVAGGIRVITTVTGRKARVIIPLVSNVYMTHFANGVELIECGLFRSSPLEAYLFWLGSKAIRRQACEPDIVIQDPLQPISPSSPSNSIASLKP